MSRLAGYRKQFAYYQSLGEKTMAQVPDEGLFWQPNSESNSIATIVKHLWGNMLSRWTDFLTTDGEKPWREREAEFDNDLMTREEVMEKWKEGWNTLYAALDSLTEADMEKTIYIRNEPHSVEDAIIRQLAHYPYHVGQMVYIGKLLLAENWKSLSIPRGGTKAFNAEKFSQGK
ncbi:MAG TPA: hypothetical protein DIW47_08590 [Bacteroidetes bacterium]|nr:hypothetical protein [Bacteroidota bacterium]